MSVEPPVDAPGHSAGIIPPAADALVANTVAGWSRRERLCSCASRYHVLWSALRAGGAHRGIYTESAQLQALAAPIIPRGGRVLVAGAADEVSLELLMDAAAGRGVQWTVVDRCAAPLAAVRELGERRGEAVHAVQSLLHEVVPTQPWHLVFIHYTLSFLDAQTRQQTLRHLALQLAAGGRVLCAAKFSDEAAVGDDARIAGATRWTAAQQARMAHRFAAHPEVLAYCEQHLAAYGQERAARVLGQPDLPVLVQEFATAGLQLLATHTTERRPLGQGEATSLQHQHSVVLVACAAAR